MLTLPLLVPCPLRFGARLHHPLFGFSISWTGLARLPDPRYPRTVLPSLTACLRIRPQLYKHLVRRLIAAARFLLHFPRTRPSARRRTREIIQYSRITRHRTPAQLKPSSSSSARHIPTSLAVGWLTGLPRLPCCLQCPFPEGSTRYGRICSP